MECPYPMRIPHEKYPGEKTLDKIVPCGSCHACKYNYQQDWIMRLRWEHNDPKTINSSFWTLTYTDDKLPTSTKFNNQTGEVLSEKPTLDPEELTNFWKRLRRYHDYHYNWDPKIRYYSVAEYGTNFERPHYHALLFNLHPDFLKKDYPIGKGWVNRKMDRCVWHNGFTHFGECTQKSIAYCAKFHLLPNDRYQDDGRIKEFATMSKVPYIGNYYVRANKQLHLDADMFYCRTPSGKKRRLPEIFKKKIWTKKAVKPKMGNTTELHEVYDAQATEPLREKQMNTLNHSYLAELELLERKGYKDPHAEYQRRLINKEKSIKRYAESKKGSF